MKNEYAIAAVAAISLAILFPMYWIFEALTMTWGDWDQMAESLVQLSFADGAFLLLGALSILVYFYLKKILNDQQNFKTLDAPLWIMIVMSIIFYSGLFVMTLIASFGDYNLLADGGWLAGLIIGLSVISFVLFGIVDIVIGIILIRNHKKLPSITLVLAVVALIQGIFEITIIFAEATLVTFPIFLIVAAIYFLRTPETVEVV